MALKAVSVHLGFLKDRVAVTLHRTLAKTQGITCCGGRVVGAQGLGAPVPRSGAASRAIPPVSSPRCAPAAPEPLKAGAWAAACVSDVLSAAANDGQPAGWTVTRPVCPGDSRPLTGAHSIALPALPK